MKNYSYNQIPIDQVIIGNLITNILPQILVNYYLIIILLLFIYSSFILIVIYCNFPPPIPIS